MIKRRDTKQPVVLKGLNLMYLKDERRATLRGLLEAGLGYVLSEGWKINLLRVGLDADYVGRQLATCDGLVDLAAENGIYVWFNPHNGETSKQTFLPDKGVLDVMGTLSQRFSQRQNVIYGLFNEPSPEMLYYAETGNFNTPREKGFRRWMEEAQPIASAIRSASPSALIIVPGSDNYARDFTFCLDKPFTIDGSPANIVYDAHRIPALDNPNNKTDPLFQARMQSQPDFVRQRKHPLIFGEFNGVLAEEQILPLSSIDTKWMRDVMGIVNKNPGQVHYTAWALDPWGTSGIFYPARSTMLSARGKIVLEDITSFPPTKF
jgi:hypothetical protein